MWNDVRQNTTQKYIIPKKLLGENEDFESERNIAFKRGQRVFALFAERSNEKELNAKRATPFLLKSYNKSYF